MLRNDSNSTLGQDCYQSFEYLIFTELYTLLDLVLLPDFSSSSQATSASAVTVAAAAAATVSSTANEQQLQHLRVQQLTEALVPLQKECERIVRENNALTMELVALQKRRIALEILLERLTPL